MRVTLAQYQRLTAEEKAKVTHIDANVADENDEAVVDWQQQLDDQYDKDHEDEGR